MKISRCGIAEINVIFPAVLGKGFALQDCNSFKSSRRVPNVSRTYLVV